MRGLISPFRERWEEFHQKIDHLFYVKPRVLQDRLDEIGRDEVADYESHIEVYDIVQEDDLILDRYIKQIEAETLIIWGDKDRFKDVSGAYFLGESIAHSTVHILPDAGHALFQEYPEKIAELYKEFLVRVSHGSQNELTLDKSVAGIERPEVLTAES